MELGLILAAPYLASWLALHFLCRKWIHRHLAIQSWRARVHNS